MMDTRKGARDSAITPHNACHEHSYTQTEPLQAEAQPVQTEARPAQAEAGTTDTG